MTDMATPVQPTEAELHDQYVRNQQARITRAEVEERVKHALTDTLTVLVDSDEMEKETAKRIYDMMNDRLGVAWNNPFQNKYLVKVYLDYDKVLEVEVEADDESEAQDEVEQNIEVEEMVITGTISVGGESETFETELSSYDYDIESRLSYRVSEVD